MKKKKIFSTVIAWFLVISMVLGGVPLGSMKGTAVVKAASGNLARDATASANGSEAGTTYTPEKAIDGLTGKKDRWASLEQNGPHWLQLTFPSSVTIKDLMIQWERGNPTDYMIQTSKDGTNWNDLVSFQEAPADHRQVIKLGSAVTTKYLRVYIQSFIKNIEGVDWNTVSIMEIEAYEDSIPASVEDIAKEIIAPVLSKEDTTLPLPEVPDNATIELVGADYEQVIDKTGQIHKPVEDTQVAVTYKVSLKSSPEESAKTDDLLVSVPGIFTNGADSNAKPTVIPELREWHGTTGNFTVGAQGKIVVRTADQGTLMETAKIFAADYKEITGKEIRIVTGDTPDSGDFFLTGQTSDTGLGEEGYYLRVEDSLTIESEAATGIFYGTRSVLQILKQTNGTIPKGIARDYPKFKVRGFMFDVGRKAIPWETIEDIMKTMSWYKLNDFQLHLNDNYIFLEDYKDSATALEKAYTGFRMESDIVGENGIPLTSTDLYYTKEEFRNFISLSKQYGINIVPEFDTPSHALSLVRSFPELMYHGSSSKPEADNAQMLDLTNPKSFELVKRIWDEYLDGENPVFTGDVINVGADEFYGTSSQYRIFADQILKYARDEKKKTPRIWGSLSSKTGTESVTSEGVQMYIWNKGWAQPDEMYRQGYDLINILDYETYIVPGADYYNDYLNLPFIYNSWKPNDFEKTVLSATEDQVLGGAFALWNDLIDLKSNGLTVYDLFDRIHKAIQPMSEKLWGDAKDKTYEEFQQVAKKVGTAPDSNPYFTVKSNGDTVVSYDFNQENITDASGNQYNAVEKNQITTTEGVSGSAILLNQNNSYVTLPISNIGPKYYVSMWVKRAADSDDSEQILFESSRGELKAVQKETGKLGISREGYDYSFNYTLPKGEWVKLGFEGYKDSTNLYINGKYQDEISMANTVVVNEVRSVPQHGTFIFPLERLGSKTKAFQGAVDNLEVKNTTSRVPQENITATATSETKPAMGNDGGADYAIDGNISTLWHTNYQVATSLPQSITLELNKPYDISQFVYVPRATGLNGVITRYEIWAKGVSGDFTKVKDGTWEKNNVQKTVVLDLTDITAVCLVALEGAGNFASAAEIYLGMPMGDESMEPDAEIESFEKVPDITIKVNGTYTLPATVRANYMDGSQRDVAVTWDESGVDKTKEGTYKAVGTVAETSLKPEVVIKVTEEAADPVIVSFEKVADVNISINGIYILPNTVKANYSDGSQRDVFVTWDKSTVDITKEGTYIAVGTVEGTTLTVDVTVKVTNGEIPDPIIVSLGKVAGITIPVNGTFTLPPKVIATYSDGSKREVPVTWDTSSIHTEKEGTYTAIGTVEGTALTVEAIITVEKKTEPLPVPVPSPNPNPGGDSSQSTPVPETTKQPESSEENKIVVPEVKTEDNKVTVTVAEKDLNTDGYTAENPLKVSVTIPKDSLVNLIGDEKTENLQVTVTIPSENEKIKITDIILPKEVITESKNKGKGITAAIKNEQGKEIYSWSFDGKDLKNAKSIKDLNLNLDILEGSGDKAISEILNKDKKNINGTLLNFAYKENLPATGKVEIYVGDKKATNSGKSSYLFAYNSSTKKYEQLQNSKYSVDTNGYVNIQITKGSSYVLLSAQPDQTLVKTQVSNTKVTSKSNVTAGKQGQVKVTLPTGYKKADSISYKTSNSKIVTVAKNGRVTGKKPGTVKITSTVKLDGYTKSFTTTVTVKKAK